MPVFTGSWVAGEQSVLIADPYYPANEALQDDLSSFWVYDDRDNVNFLNPTLRDGVAQHLPNAGKVIESTTLSGPRARTTIVVASASTPPYNFTDRLYNRIHVNPNQINAGNLIDNQTYPIEVWNAYFTPRDFLDIVETGGEGINITFPDGEVIPFVIPALGIVDVDLEVTTAGPPVINATFDFTFEGGEIIPVTVDGARTLVWPVPPDMSQAYGEKFQWTTDIITAESGKEQRISLREYPEVSIEGSYTAFFDDLNFADSLMWGWQSRTWAIPLFHLPVKLQQNADAGNTVIYVSNTDYKRFDLGDLAILYCNPKHFEAVEIIEVNQDNIVLERPLQQDWPLGTTVLPLRLAKTEREIAGQWPVNRVGTLTARFILEDDEPIPAAEDGELYQGYYILPIRPNWIESMDHQFIRNLDIITNEVGDRIYVDHSDLATIVRSFLFYFKDKSAIYKFMQWYYARRGAQVPFWVPSWKNDMVLAKDIIAGESFIRVKSNNYSSLYVKNAGRDHLYIIFRTGEIYTREILSIEPYSADPTQEVFVLDQPFPDNHDAKMIDMISFMGLHRMASDNLTVEWKSDRVVQINSNMRMLSDGV